MTGLSLGSQLSGLASFGKLLHVAHADCSGFCESPTRGRRDRKARRTSLRSSRFTTKHELVLDRATAQRTAVQLKSGGRRLLRKVISSNECTGAQRIDESGAPSARIPGWGFEVAPTLGPPIKGTAAEDAQSCTSARTILTPILATQRSAGSDRVSGVEGGGASGSGASIATSLATAVVAHLAAALEAVSTALDAV